MRQSVFLAAALLGVLSVYQPAIAQHESPPGAPSVAQPPAQVSSRGVTILRGSVPPRPLPLPPLPIIPYEGTGYEPPSAPPPGPGWDASGFDRNFDRSGLEPAQ